MSTFQHELTVLLNKHCEENESNTPDFVLAKYMCACLYHFNAAVLEREKWYGRGDVMSQWQKIENQEKVLPSKTPIGPDDV